MDKRLEEEGDEWREGERRARNFVLKKSSEIWIEIQISLQFCVTLRLKIKALCVHFFNFDHLRNYTSKFRSHLRHKFRAPSLPLPPFIFSYLQALIHGFLWWWGCSWLIFSLKWRLQSSFLLLHSAVTDLQEEKNSIDEEDPRPTSSTWRYIMWYQEHLHLGDVLLLPLSFCSVNSL